MKWSKKNTVLILSINLYQIDNLGGEGEIRTRGGVASTDVFKTSALDHYATSPKVVLFYQN